MFKMNEIEGKRLTPGVFETYLYLLLYMYIIHQYKIDFITCYNVDALKLPLNYSKTHNHTSKMHYPI